MGEKSHIYLITEFLNMLRLTRFCDFEKCNYRTPLTLEYSNSTQSTLKFFVLYGVPKLSYGLIDTVLV